METNLHKFLKDITKTLGLGHREKIYQNALIIELQNNGYNVLDEVEIDVIYQNKKVGKVRLDIIVNDEIIIEMKTLVKLTQKERNQVKRYLLLKKLKLGYLININNKKYEIEKIKF